MKKIKRVFFYSLIVLLAVGLTGHWLLHSGEKPVAFRTAKITRGTIAQSVSATGPLNPVDVANVGTQVSGQVSKLYVKVNDQVKKGQLLAEIDPSLLLAQVKQDSFNLETAKINYEQAIRDMKRTKALLAKDYLAQVDLEHAQQTFIQAKNGYDTAKIQCDRDDVNLNYSKITSPIDGVIISQDVTIGQTLAASYQTPNMFKIAGDLTKMKIEINLSESDIGKVKVHMPVTFTVDAFPDREFAGEVSLINLNPKTQAGGGTAVSYTANVEVENKDKSLLPGMTAYANIILLQKNNVLRVPLSALHFVPPPVRVSSWRSLIYADAYESIPYPSPSAGHGKQQIIYLLVNGAAVAKSVEVGATDDSYAEISGDGIAENTDVIIGLTRVRAP